MAFGISTEEFASRRNRLLEHACEKQAKGVVLFDSAHTFYFTGFNFLSTERPVIFAMATTGNMALLVPGFEADHVKLKTAIQSVYSYPEYPGEKHPMYILAEMLGDMGIDERIVADGAGYPGVLGYRGPSLSDVTSASIVLVHDFIEHMIALKSHAEINLIRESGRWCSLGQELLQRYSVPGAREAQASLRAESEATLTMLETLGDGLQGRQGSSDGVKAGYRGQIGQFSSLAHALTGNYTFQDGDVLVSDTAAPVCGYNAEVERTMIIGVPTDDQERLFNHMMAAQEVAFEAMRPGRTCADVDRDVLAYFENNDLLPYWGQHVGHAIGLRNHEAPFLDIGDHTVIQPGMVFTLEPGIYVAGVAGFRHSDTVAVTEDGIDVLTEYPRDLESLTIGV